MTAGRAAHAPPQAVPPDDVLYGADGRFDPVEGVRVLAEVLGALVWDLGERGLIDQLPKRLYRIADAVSLCDPSNRRGRT